MREKLIDEFEALFEQAAIPVLDIPKMDLGRISAVFRNDALDQTVLEVAKYLGQRFNAKVRLHWVNTLADESARATAQGAGFEMAQSPFTDIDALVAQMGEAAVQLALVSDPKGSDAQVLALGPLVEALRAPILILRDAVNDPAAIFRKILHSLTGTFEQKRSFAFSFHLAEAGGEVLVLHTMAHHQIDEVREALQLSARVTGPVQQDVLEQMAQHGQRYLRGVVAAARDLPCHVTYRIQIGDALEVIGAQLNENDHSLLVVGAHRQGKSHVEAEVYQLMHEIRDRPVLAL